MLAGPAPVPGLKGGVLGDFEEAVEVFSAACYCPRYRT